MINSYYYIINIFVKKFVYFYDILSIAEGYQAP